VACLVVLGLVRELVEGILRLLLEEWECLLPHPHWLLVTVLHSPVLIWGGF
jgi:hypothetical protein